MANLKFLFSVSLVAIMTVTAVNADIASTTYYVGDGGSTAESTATKAIIVAIKNGKAEISAKQATASQPGVMRLYKATGTQENGTMTQKSITDALALKQNSSTAVTHTEKTAAGADDTPVYVTSGGAAKAVTSITNSLLPVATTSAKGAVIVGDNIAVKDGKISVATADGSTLGVVKAGTNVSVDDGAVSVATATPTTPGVAKIGVIPSGSETATTYATIWVQ